jgi:hypothetical protein
MQTALVLTTRCNATCTHCVTSCGPHRTDALAQHDIMRLMNEAAEIMDGEPLRFSITGGEPFLDFDLLRDVVAHAGRLRAWISVTTNGYWARSEDAAASKLAALHAAGLCGVAVSVSRFHQSFVPLSRVRRVLEVAARLGLSTALKGAVTTVDLEPGNSLDTWKDQLDADTVEIFPVFPFIREGATLPESEFYRETGLPGQQCPNEIVCIEPSGSAVSCCGPGSATRFLTIGNVHRDSLSTINSRFKAAGKQRILREKGPIAFAKGAIAAGLGHLLRSEYAGPCDLCMHVGSDPRLRRVAEEMSLAVDASRLSAPENSGDVL